MLTLKRCSLFLVLSAVTFGCGNTAAPAPGSDASVVEVSSHDQLSAELVSNDSQGGFDLSDDATILSGLPGAKCVLSVDCDNGLCLPTENGLTCLQTCGAGVDCPAGYECNSVGSGADKIFACFSARILLCDPCKADSDCNSDSRTGNVCLSSGNAGNFCGLACDPMNSVCPSGYSCQVITIDPTTKTTSAQCVPVSGECPCSPRAEQLKLFTSCVVKNPFGSCTGERMCTAAGLSSCDGKVPAEETCNGLDDNCDGITDNIDTNVVTTCFKKNEFGTCSGKFIGCSDGVASCNAPLAIPEQCNGLDDNCNGLTDEGLCNDGNPCTTDKCNTDGSCNNTQLSGTACDDNDICTQTSQCAAGVCKGGTKLLCDDTDPCTTDWCDPFTGCDHKPATDGTKCLEDGNLCTQDICVSGACTHPNMKDGTDCLQDNNVCTDDVCSNGSCAHLSNTVKCDDGNPCTVNDHCGNFTCSVSTPAICDDQNVCTLNTCDPSIGCNFIADTTQDGQACTVNAGATQGVCVGAICSY